MDGIDSGGQQILMLHRPTLSSNKSRIKVLAVRSETFNFFEEEPFAMVSQKKLKFACLLLCFWKLYGGAQDEVGSAGMTLKTVHHDAYFGS